MKLSRYRKAVAAFIGNLSIVGVNWVATGALDMEELRIGIAGLVGVGLVILFPPNEPASEGTSYETQGTPTLR